MKFDVIVGNPPYQDSEAGSHNIKLWSRFLAQSSNLLKPEGSLAFLIPVSLFADSRPMANYRKKLLPALNLKFAKYIKDDVFQVGVKILYLLATKEQYKNKTKVEFEDENVEVDLQKALPMTSEQREFSKIYNKMLNESIPRLEMKIFNLTLARDKCQEKEGTAIYFSGNQLTFTNEEIEGANQLKLVIPFSAAYYSAARGKETHFITECATGMLNSSVLISSVEEGKMIQSYTTSRLYRFLASTWNKTSGFTPIVKVALLPKMPTKFWTDQEIYEYFNLTKEEIKLIEETVK